MDALDGNEQEAVGGDERTTKKAKTESSWRQKSIDTWKLKAFPESLKNDEISEGSESAWKRYYKFRKECESNCADRDEGEPGPDLEDEWRKELDSLSAEILKENDVKWQYSCFMATCVLEDYQELRTGRFCCYVWSPFATPRALLLTQYHHNRPRMNSYEFSCVWEYKTIDFDDDEYDDASPMEDMTELGSCYFGDEVLRNFIIETPGLNRMTVLYLRDFLFGGSSEPSNCTHYDFMQLILASSGTFKYNTVWAEDIGWGCREFQKDEDRFVKISWLEYYVRKATGCLREIDKKYYRNPTEKDAIGYESQYSDEEAEEGENPSELDTILSTVPRDVRRSVASIFKKTTAQDG